MAASGKRVSGPVADVDSRPTELLGATVGVHPHGVVEGARAVGLLLEDHHRRELLEAQRDPEPVERRFQLGGPSPRRHRLADGADAPRPVARGGEVLRRDVPLLATGAQLALPRADPEEAAGVEHRLGPSPQLVVRLVVDRHGRRPHEVARHLVAVSLAHDPHLVERLDHLDADRSDLHPHPVVIHRVAGPHDVLHVADAHAGVGVADAEVGVHAEPGDELQVELAVGDDVEDVAVVEVPIARADVRHRAGDLVDRVLVERVCHRRALSVNSQDRCCLRLR